MDLKTPRERSRSDKFCDFSDGNLERGPHAREDEDSARLEDDLVALAVPSSEKKIFTSMVLYVLDFLHERNGISALCPQGEDLKK